jgi:hypothetical protein
MNANGPLAEDLPDGIIVRHVMSAGSSSDLGAGMAELVQRRTMNWRCIPERGQGIRPSPTAFRLVFRPSESNI